MSTPASSKVRLVLLSLLLALGSYAGFAAILGRLAVWAEFQFEAYPYDVGEDGMRVLLPGVLGRATPKVMIAGPSAVREGILYEVISQAVGGRVVSAGLSNGTLDDITITLEYVLRVYGREALPQHLILGLTPRVVANLPRSFGPERTLGVHAPLIPTLNRYSPHYAVRSQPLGSVLERKSAWAAWVARWRWLAKQQPRYRTALLAAVEFMVDDDPLKVGFQAEFPPVANFRTPFSQADWRITRRYVRAVGIRTASRHWLPAYRSLYLKNLMPPEPVDTIRRYLETWEVVHAWDPDSEESLVRSQLRRLRDLLAEYGVSLMVLHMPEHPLSRDRYNKDFYHRYTELVAEELPDATILDLWELLPADSFYDNIHLTYLGASAITEVVIRALEQQAKGRDESLSVHLDTRASGRLSL